MHIVILGSSPNISIFVKEKQTIEFKAREAQPGRAELWRCLGCKFKSYLEHLCIFFSKVMMELADMNSLGLFDFKSYPFKSDLPYNGLSWIKKKNML